MRYRAIFLALCPSIAKTSPRCGNSNGQKSDKLVVEYITRLLAAGSFDELGIVLANFLLRAGLRRLRHGEVFAEGSRLRSSSSTGRRRGKSASVIRCRPSVSRFFRMPSRGSFRLQRASLMRGRPRMTSGVMF